MEIKNELHTELFKSSDRTYFLHLNRAKNKALYLSICESKHKDDGKYEQQRVIIFEENFKLFIDNLKKVFKIYNEIKHDIA